MNTEYNEISLEGTGQRGVEGTLQEKLKFIETFEGIPPMPAVVMNLLSKLDDPRVKMKEIEQIMSVDPALVSYFLRVANSPLLGLRSKVLNVSKAISVVGLARLKTMLIAYGVRFLYKTIKHPEIRDYLWEHAIHVGVLAKMINELIFKTRHKDIYVYGLLHDIGKIVLLMHAPDKFNEAMELGMDKRFDGVTAEAEHFGFSHIEAGYFLVSKLGFPEEMKEIILFHHNPEYCAKENYP
ncbi:MAG: HDOD domain-containing protein, partial [bacterium]|nr:HDOD domain-containing protein [bacterium]